MLRMKTTSRCNVRAERLLSSLGGEGTTLAADDGRMIQIGWMRELP